MTHFNNRWFKCSKISALRHFGSLLYRSNSSFLLGPGSLATSDLVLWQFRRFGISVPYRWVLFSFLCSLFFFL
ncbi:unnamed protein product [Rhizophagus irregularis]|nr:unnamed protein product [Rhizophagus irregularis]